MKNLDKNINTQHFQWPVNIQYDFYLLNKHLNFFFFIRLNQSEVTDYLSNENIA